MHIVQISDTHISHLGGVTSDNLEKLASFVNDQLRPDLVVHTGDIVILDPDRDDDRLAAFDMGKLFDAPVRFLPGNHDVGQPGDAPWKGISVTSERICRYREVFGSDHWVLELGGWVVIGLNSEVIGSSLDEEGEQWDWLAGVAAEHRGSKAILFLHRPLWPAQGWPEIPDHLLSLFAHERDRLLSTLAGVELVAVGSGHLHQYACYLTEGIITASAPSTAFIANETSIGHGLPQLGVVEYSDDHGSLQVKYRTLADLDERVPWDMPAFSDALRDIEARIEPAS